MTGLEFFFAALAVIGLGLLAIIARDVSEIADMLHDTKCERPNV